MKNETCKNKYGCGLTDDITFCANECDEKRCFRNPMWIIDKKLPHSYSHFKGTSYCYKAQTPPTVEDSIWYWKGYEEGYQAAVEQVKEGKDSINKYYGSQYNLCFYCPKCGERMTDNIPEQKLSNYCPRCGQKLE